jgi:rare lipoprotein A
MYWAAVIVLFCGLTMAAADDSQKPSPFGKRKPLPTAKSSSKAPPASEPVKKSTGSADRTGTPTAPSTAVAQSAPAPSAGEKVQTGIATFYADAEHGKETASGGTYDNEKLTAAHPSFPFGSHLRVTNVKSGKAVEVTVTDRGRFSGERIISVSRRAAEELGFVSAGTARVKVELLD